MQTPTILTLLLFPLLAQAQQFPDMNQHDMQQMMQSMKKVQVCMDKIDKNKIKQLESDSNIFEDKVQQLCANGERKKAQDIAQIFGKKMMNNVTIKEINKCSKMMQGVTLPNEMSKFEGDYKNRHVCDSIAADK